MKKKKKKINIGLVIGFGGIHSQLVSLSIHHSLYRISDLLIESINNDDDEQNEGGKLIKTPNWENLLNFDCSHNFIDKMDSSLR